MIDPKKIADTLEKNEGLSRQKPADEADVHAMKHLMGEGEENSARSLSSLFSSQTKQAVTDLRPERNSKNPNGNPEGEKSTEKSGGRPIEKGGEISTGKIGERPAEKNGERSIEKKSGQEVEKREKGEDEKREKGQGTASFEEDDDPSADALAEEVAEQILVSDPQYLEPGTEHEVRIKIKDSILKDASVHLIRQPDLLQARLISSDETTIQTLVETQDRLKMQLSKHYDGWIRITIHHQPTSG